MLWIVLGAILVVVVLYDLIQSKHAVLRNFPLIGHFRYWLESVGATQDSLFAVFRRLLGHSRDTVGRCCSLVERESWGLARRKGHRFKPKQDERAEQNIQQSNSEQNTLSWRLGDFGL